MIDQLVRLFAYEFVQNAIAAGVIIALVSGIVSRFVVARNQSFAVHALAELGFSGAAGAILLGVSPILGLLAGTTTTAIFIGTLGVRLRERDTVVGVVMAFGLGLGVLFLTLYPRYATQAFAILFGTITGVSRTDVVLLVLVGIVTIAAMAVIYRPLTFATVDPEVAEARGVPVRLLALAFLLIMAAAVSEAVQAVGVLLILTMLITPGATAERLTSRPGRAVLLCVGIAEFCMLGGIALALLTNLPVSVYVTSLSFAVYLIARFGIGPRQLGRESRRQPLVTLVQEASEDAAPTLAH
ncbi:MAG: metal ABC transporter permease [Candidatus Limnocylindrales bacterium]